MLRLTIPAAQFRAPIQTVLRLQEGNIFGEPLEWHYHRDNDEVVLNLALRLHPESFQMNARRGEPIRCTFAVATARYWRNMTREELLVDEPRNEPTFQQPALCNSCRNLHGQTYNGVKMVCGIHPYGNGEQCGDFEAK